MRKRRSLASDDSMMTRTTVNRSILTRISGIASKTCPGCRSSAKPQGATNTFRKMQVSTRNFICPPHFISAAPRPEYSKPLDSSIIANSKCPVGLSTGILPPSARISMKNAISRRICAGEKKAAGLATHFF